MACYLVLLGVLAFTTAHGQPAEVEIRIGLQTKQATVCVQSMSPLRVTGGLSVYNAPAEQLLVCTPVDGGVHVADKDGAVLLTAGGPVLIAPDKTASAALPENSRPTLFIRLLGPTRHYDGKADRPYRGVFEILPRDGGLTVVNRVPLEPYLWGVVSSEMGPAFPAEALKAQAVAARTYAVKNIGRFSALGYDLDDTPGSQVYGGVFSEDPRTTQAVTDTTGMLLRYNGQLVDALYASTCGGYTEAASEAYGHDVPYLRSVSDFSDAPKTVYPRPTTEDEWLAYFKSMKALNCLQPVYANPQAFRWVVMLKRKDLEAALPAGLQVGTIMNLTPVRRGASGRLTALRIEGADRGVTVEKEAQIRHYLGGLRSSAFAIETFRDDNGVPVVFAIWGGGWGHGLGMCQVGAVGLALQGLSYEKILSYYYQGVSIGQ